MNLFAKSVLLSSAILASVAMAAPKFPFPQNKTYPYGNTFTYANPDSIKAKFKAWKDAWYTEASEHEPLSSTGSENANKGMPSGTARVISPEVDSKFTVSEGIGYGMLLMVYMSSAQEDYQNEFDKLWRFWKCYGNNLNGNGCDSWNGQGMDWKINTYTGSVATGGSGTASDAEFDAALALVMAYKQWDNEQYLNDAKKLIDWIKINEMRLDKAPAPGNQWDPAFNPSYSSVAAFKLFYEVTNDAFWNEAITSTLSHLSKCQNAKTGLMSDWCDWNTHKAITTNAQAGEGSGLIGFYSDAARTPWRMAWGVRLYGIEGAKAANDKIEPWLLEETYEHAAMISFDGYELDHVPGSLPENQNYNIISTYVGGLGLSMLSSSNPKYYLETIYETLLHRKSKTSVYAGGNGENYFAATLNVLYLLTLTGNMPNFYNMTGYKDYTPNPSGVRMPKSPTGTLLPKNSGIVAAGFTNWGSYVDDLGQSKMLPEDQSSAIYEQEDGTYIVAGQMYIGCEPESGDDYPYAGIAVSFGEDSAYFDLTDLATIRLTYKSQGVVRLSLLDKATMDNDQEGGEPGYYLHPTEDWKTIEIPLTIDNTTNSFVYLNYPKWVRFPPEPSEVLPTVRGFKLDAKMVKGGFASIELKELQMLDANGEIISSLKGINPITPKVKSLASKSLMVLGKSVVFNGFGKNAKAQVFDLNGNCIKQLSVNASGSLEISELARAKGSYILRLSGSNGTQSLRFIR